MLNLIRYMALGGALLIFLYVYLKKNINNTNSNRISNFLIKVLIATFIINLLECFGGLFVEYVYGISGWDYSSYFYPMCHNYISITTIIYWTVLIAVLYGLSDYFL